MELLLILLWIETCEQGLFGMEQHGLQKVIQYMIHHQMCMDIIINGEITMDSQLKQQHEMSEV